MSSEIRYEVRDNIGTITLAAPERRNALTPEMADELVRALDALDVDDSVGAVIIRGDRGRFCAGAHRGTLAEAERDPSADSSVREVNALYAAFTRVGQMRAPTIAAVRGAAVGAGMNLALAADLRIVAKHARLISGFDRIGVHPGGGHFHLLHRAAGRQVAAGMGVFGAEVDGDRALELGLAWAAVDGAEVDAAARDVAGRAAEDPELSRQLIASLRHQVGPPEMSWPAALEAERGVQMWSFARRSSAG